MSESKEFSIYVATEPVDLVAADRPVRLVALGRWALNVLLIMKGTNRVERFEE